MKSGTQTREDYTADKIRAEWLDETEEDLVNMLARQKHKERGFRLQ